MIKNFDLKLFRSLTTLRLNLWQYGQEHFDLGSNNLQRLLQHCTSLRHLFLYANYVNPRQKVTERFQPVLSSIPPTVTSLNIVELSFPVAVIMDLIERSPSSLQQLYWRREHLDRLDQRMLELVCDERGVELYSDVARLVDVL